MIFLAGRTIEKPFTRPRFLLGPSPERASSDFTAPRLVSSVGSAVMITGTFGLPLPSASFFKTGATYVSGAL